MNNKQMSKIDTCIPPLEVGALHQRKEGKPPLPNQELQYGIKLGGIDSHPSQAGLMKPTVQHHLQKVKMNSLRP